MKLSVMGRCIILRGWRGWLQPYSHRFKFIRKWIGGKWELWTVYMCGGHFTFTMWLSVCHFDDEPDVFHKQRLDHEDWGKE